MSKEPYDGKHGPPGDDALVYGDTRDLVRVLPEVLSSVPKRRVM
jgi:hypothetical protein